MIINIRRLSKRYLFRNLGTFQYLESSRFNRTTISVHFYVRNVLRSSSYLSLQLQYCSYRFLFLFTLSSSSLGRNIIDVYFPYYIILTFSGYHSNFYDIVGKSNLYFFD